MEYIKASSMQGGEVLGKRPQNSPPPTMLIKNQLGTKKAAHIFTAKEVTSLQLNPDSIKQEQDLQQEHRQIPPKYTRPETPKQSPKPQNKSPPKSDPTDHQSTERSIDEVKITHEETTARLRKFIKKRTVAEAFNPTSDKTGPSYQPWIPSASNLRKATSEPNIKAKAKPQKQKLPAFSRSATFNATFSPRKDIPPTIRNRVPSITDDPMNPGHDYSPPFKFPKLDSNFFKSLPNVKSISAVDMSTEQAKLIAPDDGLIRSHPLLKEAAIESRNSSFTSFYPSLAKLINSDSSERPKQDFWSNHDLLKGLRFPDSSTSFSLANRSSFNTLLTTPPERLDLSSRNVLEYAQTQILQMQQLSQEQEEVKEQQKLLIQQQERIIKDQESLRQREVFIRKMFYDASANMAVADHMVSSLVNQSQEVNPLSMSVPDFYSSSKHTELLLKKVQEQQLAASQAEQLLHLQRSAGNLKLNSAFGHYNPILRNNISSQSAPNVQSLAASSTDMVIDPPLRTPLAAPLPTPLNPLSAALSTRTGIIYDNIMLKHICSCSNPAQIHKEIPGRLSSVWARLSETGVASRCARLKSRKATNEELELIHSPEHVCKYGGVKNKDKPQSEEEDFVRLKCGGKGKDEQTIWNDFYSSQAARIAAGSVLELATKVAMGELQNAFALVRPPGHLAERNEAREGCYFNNVAIAAKHLIAKKLSNRVLIVDWDMEHGNGLQQAFYNDPNVLVINIHRYDNGTFFPRTGHVTCEGAVKGKGFNINIPFSGSTQAEYGDPEYLAAFRCVIKPVAEQFCPDIVLISAGYNAMGGHDSYNVTAECFAFMTQELGRLAEGRIMLALEGGYNLVSLSQACEMCIRSLLGEQITHLPARSLKCAPNSFAVKAVEECIAIHRKYWQFTHYSNHISLSVYDAVKRDQEEVDTITALASLSMQHPNNFNHTALNNGAAVPARTT